MTDFDDDFAARAAPALLDRFGEWINFLPKSGPPRRIQAIVDRFGLHAPGETEGLLGQHCSIEVLDDPENGISSAMLDTGGDRIEIALKKGKEPLVTLPIVSRTGVSDKGGNIPVRDHGFLQLSCGS